MHFAKREMTDFQRIRVASPARRFSGAPLTPAHVLERHRQAVAWLTDELRRPWPGQTVLVSHHSPTAATLDEWGWGALNPCYASDLEWLLDGEAADRPAIDLAIHGHMHVRADTVVRRTRVVVNARGYARPGHLVPDFDPQLVVELAEQGLLRDIEGE